MSNGIYERRQMDVEDLYQKRYPTWAWIGVAVAVVSFLTSIYFENKRRVEAKAVSQAAYEAAVSKAPIEIESAFKNWTAITADKDVAVKWSGAESEILYIRFRPTSTSGLRSVDESWEVWARTKTGKLFVVDCWLDENRKVVVGETLKQSSSDNLLRVLLIDKKTDLIEKLKFPVTPA